jgi:DNA-binding NarL/FixJ family response regulator
MLGMGIREIAFNLDIADSTVKSHMTDLGRKFNIDRGKYLLRNRLVYLYYKYQEQEKCH